MTLAVDSTPKVYFIDLEVDSVPVEQGQPRRCITQLCIYDPSREKGQRVFEANINPPKQLRHKEDTVSFGHGTTQKPKYEFSVVWPHLKAWVNQGLDGNRFAVFVGHNIYKHDWPILENELARIKEAIPKYWKPFCTLYLAGAMGIPKGERSLSSLCKRYEVKHLDQHDAYNDVQMLVNVFGKMIQGADFKRIANAMVLPPREHPVREVANIIQSTQEAVMVFFDFEATGLFPKAGETGENPRATELGAYIPSKNATFSSLIDPGLDEGVTLSKIVVEKTHITEEMIREAAVEYKERTGKKMNFQAVWMDFEAWMEHQIGPTVKKVVVLAGHNIWGYDLPLYKSESERFGMKTKWWKSMDTCVLSRHLYKGHTPQPKGFHSLEQLGKRMQIEHENAHRALADVIANAKVWNVFVDGVPEDKISEALLSKHPILSTGQLVREEGGTFKPENYMEVPQDVPMGSVGKTDANNGAVVKNPFLVDDEERAPAPEEFFGLSGRVTPVVVPTPAPSHSSQFLEETGKSSKIGDSKGAVKRTRERTHEENPPLKRKRLHKIGRKKIFSDTSSTLRQPAITDFVRVESPIILREDNSQETTFTFQLSIPRMAKRKHSDDDIELDLDSDVGSPSPQQEVTVPHKKRKMLIESDEEMALDDVDEEERDDEPLVTSSAQGSANNKSGSSRGNFVLEFSDSL